jgi:hypothetical protein
VGGFASSAVFFFVYRLFVLVLYIAGGRVGITISTTSYYSSAAANATTGVHAGTFNDTEYKC